MNGRPVIRRDLLRAEVVRKRLDLCWRGPREGERPKGPDQNAEPGSSPSIEAGSSVHRAEWLEHRARRAERRHDGRSVTTKPCSSCYHDSVTHSHPRHIYTITAAVRGLGWRRCLLVVARPTHDPCQERRAFMRTRAAQ